MSRFQLALLAVSALAVAGAGIITWRTRQRGRSPADAFQQLVQAARAGDRRAIEQYLDVRRTAESVVDEAFSAARAHQGLDASGSPPDEDMRPSLITLTERSIWTALLDPSATPESGALIDRYRSITGVQQQGGVARVGVLGQPADVDSAVVVFLRMERAAGQWRVTGVEGLAPYMRASYERRLERSYEAAMRAILRNLATAQDAYFAGHATYAPSLQALAYSTTPGVDIAIIAASRTGWSAVARHRQATSECRIGVGSGRPSGHREREVHCAARPA